MDLVIHVDCLNLVVGLLEFDDIDTEERLMLLHSSKAHKRVLVDHPQDTVFPRVFELQVIAIVYLEGFLLDDHFLDDVRLAFDIAASEKEKIALVLEGQQRGRGCGVGCEGGVVAVVLQFLPSLIVVV